MNRYGYLKVYNSYSNLPRWTQDLGWLKSRVFFLLNTIGHLLKIDILCYYLTLKTQNDTRKFGHFIYLQGIYSEIPLLRPPKINTFYPLKTLFAKLRWFFSSSFLPFLHLVYLWLKTTFGTVQKWSLRPLLDSPKGGLNIGILLYLQNCNARSSPRGYFTLKQICNNRCNVMTDRRYSDVARNLNATMLRLRFGDVDKM